MLVVRWPWKLVTISYCRHKVLLSPTLMPASSIYTKRFVYLNRQSDMIMYRSAGEVERSPQPADATDSIDRLMEGDALHRDTLQASDVLRRWGLSTVSTYTWEEYPGRLTKVQIFARYCRADRVYKMERSNQWVQLDDGTCWHIPRATSSFGAH